KFLSCSLTASEYEDLDLFINIKFFSEK
ncbi:uncharacterized protein METZ01_LOCUS291790, partial [marine metagenome]